MPKAPRGKWITTADGTTIVVSKNPNGSGSIYFDGAEHRTVGVPAPRVAPGFDPVEDREGELLAGGTVMLVEEFELQDPEEALGDAVEAVADGAHRGEQSR